MCDCNDGAGIRTKLVATFAAFASVAAVFTTALPTAPAEAHPARTVAHLFRPTAVPTGVPGRDKIGLWILNPSDGRVRLCMIDDPAAAKESFLKCSAWQGGGTGAGRYSMMDIGQRLPAPLRRQRAGNPAEIAAGVWVLNRATGAAQACIVTRPDEPTASLRCSKNE